jgi:hypothetical protein
LLGHLNSHVKIEPVIPIRYAGIVPGWLAHNDFDWLAELLNKKVFRYAVPKYFFCSIAKNIKGHSATPFFTPEVPNALIGTSLTDGLILASGFSRYVQYLSESIPFITRLEIYYLCMLAEIKEIGCDSATLTWLLTC